jgi:electron transfer flavoprotein alpha subunit
MTDYKHVMICGELTDDGLASITRELLNGGRKLADNLGEEFHALFLGNGVTERAREALAFGADNVYVVDNPCLDRYEGDSYAAVLAQTVERLRPRILILETRKSVPTWDLASRSSSEGLS